MIICTRGWSESYQYSSDIIFDSNDILYAQTIADRTTMVCLKHNVMDADGRAMPERIMCCVTVKELMELMRGANSEVRD